MKSKITHAQQLLDRQASDKAIQLLRPLMAKKGAPWAIFHLMGIALLQKGEHEASVKCLQKALDRGGDESETYHLLSVNYYNLGRFEEAEEFAKEALDRRDDFLKAWVNLGSLYRAQARLEEALKCYQKANQLDPQNAGIAFRIGAIYRDQGGLDKALELFDITLRIEPDYLGALLEKADIHKKRQDYEDAEACLDTALERHGDCLAIRFNRAEVLKDQGKYEEAVEIFEELLEKYPEQGGVRINYALCLQELGQFEEAEENYLEVVEQGGDAANAFSNYLMGIHYNPNRTKEEIFEAHLEWNDKFLRDVEAVRPRPENKSKDKRLRIGFVSGGFRKHPVGWMITKALENLPDEECEIYCYTTNTRHDPITKRIHDASDSWASVVGYSNEVIAGMIREDEIDILVDLSGHAADGCLGTINREPAPIIVKWVGGLFNTTGLDAVDFLISDWYETPEGEEEFYTEKLVRLPDDYICFLPPDYAPDRQPLPAKDNGYITFGCFNNPCKVNDQLLERWAAIMQQVSKSRLLLKSKQYETRSFTNRIVATMESFGIERERIIFKGHSIHQDHLDCYNDIDIALDPWPYSGGLTTCEALWMGVPVVTLPGPTFAGKHSVTHLNNAGLPGFVADNWEEYIEMAVTLASDVEKLTEIRSSLREQVAQSPICDGRRFAAHLSVAFRKMWEQRVDGYEKKLENWQDHIEVDPLSDQEVDAIVGSVSKPETQEENEIGEKILMNGACQKQTVKSAKEKSKPYKIETKEGVTVVAPSDLEQLTTFVLLEQEQWFEEELAFATAYLKSGMKAVDIGAGVGSYALPMAKKVGHEGQVFAFEPTSDTRKFLEWGKLENGFDQLEVMSQALSDEIAPATFAAGEPPEQNKLDADGSEEVSKTTLDAWWQFTGQPKIDFIKLDVAGDEAKVILGGNKFLQENSPVILFAIANQGEQDREIKELLKELGYRLFEYIPGPQLLTEHNSDQPLDSYAMSLVACKEETQQALQKSGWIYDETLEPGEPGQDCWQETLNALPWTNSLMEQWNEQMHAPENREYREALNCICAAERADSLSRLKKGALLVKGVQILIQLYNDGNTGLPVALTLVRGLKALGKREQAVEILKTVLEMSGIGKQKINVDRPFLLPLKSQDNSPIQTDIQKWLMVRVVEAWIILKDLSTYFSGSQELNFLEMLDGNPEVGKEIIKRNALVRKANGEEAEPIPNIDYNEWFWAEGKSSTKDIMVNGKQPAAGSKNATALRHLHLAVPGKKGGAHGIHEIRAQKLAKELERQGVSTSIVSSSSPDFFNKVVEAAEEQGHAFYTGVFGYDLQLHSHHGISGNLFDLLDLPVFAFLGDHPYTEFMWHRMEQCAENTVFLTPLDSLAAEVRNIYPGKAVKPMGNLFSLSADNIRNYSTAPLAERSIDILVPLGLHKFFLDQQPLKEQLKKLGASQKKIGYRVYQKAINNYEQSLFETFREVTDIKLGRAYKFGSPKSDEDRRWLKVLSLVDWQIRKDRRLEMMKHLSEIPDKYKVTIPAHPEVAKFIPELQGKQNINWIDQVSRTKLDDLYQDAKIVLNCNPTFPDKVHARVQNGMLNGCFVVSDYNPELDRIFGEEGTIGLTGEQGKKVEEYLSAGWDCLEEKAVKGRQIIESEFTLEKHAERLIEIITEQISQ
ncbi:FkbM family methyltransferase [Aliifodinibius sp. S!AR15-10]|uniref:FkbM family methyltransferase n=1 Tax=Aliifodinibius sp. S!AR15-10 TaxID=2950437 RepID=UPI002858D5B0|nr:FkbM family methyltransferase [Aliifodinibius sp. S!AR15-10]MDR8393029.1 FkbM family methyltransferase [Aliifodinibius sp. S!AR15-10]